MAVLLMPVFSLAALAGIVYGLATGKSPLDPSLLVNLGLFVVLGGLFLQFRRARQRDAQLLAWLVAHAAPIRAGGASYQGTSITAATELRTFDATVSLVVVSLKLPSRRFVAGEPSGATGFAATLTSLVLGWWGIPWGPLWTIQTVARNLRGGRRQTVGELLVTLDVRATA